MVSAFLLIYYTNAADIPASAEGTIFLVVRVWGGLTDLFAGRRADQTMTRWGRFRPCILFGSAPLLVLLVVMFSIPGGLTQVPDGRAKLSAARMAAASLIILLIACCSSPGCSRCRPSRCTTPATCSATPTCTS